MTRYKELYLFLRIKFFFYLQNKQYASTIPVIAITVPHKTSESSIMTIIPAANQNNANRGDIEAAESMLVGSLFAGIAFSFARLGNVHAMSHPVSAFFDVPHGVANAVLLPVIAEYNALADHGRYLTIYNDISPVPAYAEEFEPMMLVDAIRELCGEIGIPANLTEAINNASKTGPVSAEEIKSKIEAMAVDAMKSGNIAVNPRSSRQCDIEMLYRKAL